MSRLIKNGDMDLVVEIKNSEPLELLELTKSLVSFGNQFGRYAKVNGFPLENRSTKLYVEKIESGSVIVTLYEFVKTGVLPILGDTNTIVQFVGFLKTVFDYFKSGEGEKPELSQSDYRELNAIISPIAKDNGSQINITAKDNSVVYVSVGMNSSEANAAHNRISNELDIINKIEDGSSKKSVLLYFDRAVRNIGMDKGNKGIIEEISKDSKNVIFNTEELEQSILHEKDNPFNLLFVVDVDIIFVRGKLVAYRVTKYHDKFQEDSEQSPTH